MSQRIPRVLYHYCSLATFKNIFDNKSIWLSDIRKSNDSLELKWIMGQCQFYMLEAWTSYVAAVQKERGMDIVSHEHFEMFQKLYDLAKDYDAEDDTKNWVFCLSEKADDLGQWRGYADDGKGVTIGFNSSFIKKVNTIGDSIQDVTVDFHFARVHYSKKDVDKLFYSANLRVGDQVTIIGYPNHQTGNTPFVQRCAITSKKTYLQAPLFTVSGRIIHGASGGAVLNSNYEVVGIIKGGIQTLGDEDTNENQGFIPIHLALEHMATIEK